MCPQAYKENCEGHMITKIFWRLTVWVLTGYCLLRFAEAFRAN